MTRTEAEEREEDARVIARATDEASQAADWNALYDRAGVRWPLAIHDRDVAERQCSLSAEHINALRAKLDAAEAELADAWYLLSAGEQSLRRALREAIERAAKAEAALAEAEAAESAYVAHERGFREGRQAGYDFGYKCGEHDSDMAAAMSGGTTLAEAKAKLAAMPTRAEVEAELAMYQTSACGHADERRCPTHGPIWALLDRIPWKETP